MDALEHGIDPGWFGADHAINLMPFWNTIDRCALSWTFVHACTWAWRFETSKFATLEQSPERAQCNEWWCRLTIALLATEAGFTPELDAVAEHLQRIRCAAQSAARAANHASAQGAHGPSGLMDSLMQGVLKFRESGHDDPENWLFKAPPPVDVDIHQSVHSLGHQDVDGYLQLLHDANSRASKAGECNPFGFEDFENAALEIREFLCPDTATDYVPVEYCAAYSRGYQFPLAGIGAIVFRSDPSTVWISYFASSGGGLGRHLIGRLLRRLAARGYSSVHVWTTPNNLRAIAAYESYGFTRVPQGAPEPPDVGTSEFVALSRDITENFILVESDPVQYLLVPHAAHALVREGIVV